MLTSKIEERTYFVPEDLRFHSYTTHSFLSEIREPNFDDLLIPIEDLDRAFMLLPPEILLTLLVGEGGTRNGEEGGAGGEGDNSRSGQSECFGCALGEGGEEGEVLEGGGVGSEVERRDVESGLERERSVFLENARWRENRRFRSDCARSRRRR